MMLRKFFKFLYLVKHVKSTTSIHMNITEGNSISKYVYISKSNDVFLNLAFEDWLYQNYDFSKQQILLLWRNKPSVVIGRHQNPWLETNVKLAGESNILISRRNSGGGAVYHDTENLNLSFFTSKESYNRKYNLEIIISSLKDEWGLNCMINNREDILFEDKKISGTASKLSKNNAYHHCTLLVDCNKKIMSTMLGAKNSNIVTNATRSVPSAVFNLRESNSSVNVDRLMTVVGLKYLFTKPSVKSNTTNVISLAKGFQFVFPEEKYFPGLKKKIDQFKSWEWIYGRTPKFKIELSVSTTQFCSTSENVKIYVDVEHGVIQNIDVVVPPSFLIFVTSESMRSITALFLNQKFSTNSAMQLEETLINYFENKLEDERIKSVLYY